MRAPNHLGDYVIAAAILLGLNLFAPGANEREQSLARVTTAIEALSPEPLDLVVLGDSRGMTIDTASVARALGLRPERAFDAALVSGDWVTTAVALERLGARVDAHTLVVVDVSEFWTELGDLDDRFGVLPREPTYAELGLPLTALQSYVPLSAARGRRLQEARAWTEQRVLRRLSLWFRQPITAPSAEAPDFEGLNKSNVDLWFAPTTDDEAATRRDVGARTLARLRRRAQHLVLVDLPNAPTRDRYVAARYPERRARFLATLRALAGEAGAPFVELGGQVADDAAYRDFHHWNERGRAEGVPVLAAALRPSLPR